MNWQSDKPIYLQIKEITINKILDKKIKEGELLPSVRQLSIDFQINPLTVSKAYQLLVDDGVIIKVRGLGMRVAKGALNKLLINEKKTFLAQKWPNIVKDIQRLGITNKELGL